MQWALITLTVCEGNRVRRKGEDNSETDRETITWPHHTGTWLIPRTSSCLASVVSSAPSGKLVMMQIYRVEYVLGPSNPFTGGLGPSS